MTGASGYPQPGAQWPAQPPHPSKATWAFSVQGTPLPAPPGGTSWELLHVTGCTCAAQWTGSKAGT